MLDALYQGLYWTHVPAALSCLPAFWVAVLSKKGGRLHVGSGRWFGWGMRFVALTGIAMGLLVLADPYLRGAPPAEATPAATAAWIAKQRVFRLFILYLGVITFFPVHHGVRVIQTRREPTALATPAYRALAWLPLLASLGAIVVYLLSERGLAVVLLAMSPLGVVESLLAQRYLRDPRRLKAGWRPQHMTFMLIAGIAAHTAFAVFALDRIVSLSLPGPLWMLPWILPTLVGVPVILVWVGREARRLSRS